MGICSRAQARWLFWQRRAGGEGPVAVGEAQRGQAGSSRGSHSMVLSTERRARIRQRLEPMLKEYNPELQFISVFVDSTREYLAVVAQLADKPVLLKFRWVDFISTPDNTLGSEVRSQLVQKLGPSEQPRAAVEPAPQS